MIEKTIERSVTRLPAGRGEAQGIIIVAGRGARNERDVPRISAFIWGGKVRPSPILRFGRWKGAA